MLTIKYVGGIQTTLCSWKSQVFIRDLAFIISFMVNLQLAEKNIY